MLGAELHVSRQIFFLPLPPDAEAAEESLFVCLSDSICHCVGFYAQAIQERIRTESNADSRCGPLADERDSDGQYCIGLLRLRALDNLQEACEFREESDEGGWTCLRILQLI